MFSKSNLASTIVGAIWAYAGGYLLWDVIGSGLMENPGPSEADTVHLIIACVILAFVANVFYSKGANNHSISAGATFGLWLGILIGFGERWFDVAFGYQTSMNDAIVNGVLNVVWAIVLGILFSLVHGKMSSSD